MPYQGVVTYTLVLSNTSGVSAPDLLLTDILPISVTFGQWLQQPGSGLVQNNNTFTWTGTLTGNTVLTFSFTATHTGSYLEEVSNTAYFSGSLQTGNDAATFSVACPNTITVQNANDSGPGSLRQALTDVCSGGAVDFAAGLAGQTISLTSAELTITKTVTIINPNAPGLQISGNSAGRVFHIQSTGVVTLSSLSMVNGKADYGGAVLSYGTLTVDNSTFNGNQATYGGGILNHNMLTVNNSTFSDNQANYGGGILNDSMLTVNNSTCSSNQATYRGGGIFNAGTLTVNNSTFSANEAATGGGGLYHSSGTLHLRNSIIANSTGGDCHNSGTIATNLNNLIESTGDDACGIINGVGGSFIGVAPLLAPLADYGGATQTFALLPGSPAINAGANCLSIDQRGIIRPQIGVCDMGAFESQGFTLTYAGGSGQSTLVNTVFANPLTLIVSSSVGEPVDGGQVIFTGPVSGAGLSSSPLTATISSGIATQGVTANGIIGSYGVTATAQGNLGSAVSYTLTNTVPEMAVIGNNQVIADGDDSPSTEDHTDFGSVILGQVLTRTFTISNSGEGTLVLSGTPVISITGRGAFSVVAQPATSVAPHTHVNFQVRFTPSVSGTQVVTVTIANTDMDEAPYNFAIQGKGVTNQAPVADAGSDQSVSLGNMVTLDGATSFDPDGHMPLSYGWTQTGGPAVTLSNAAAVSPTFTAPGTPTVLTFTLWVTDTYGLAALAGDEVVVTIHDVPVSDLVVTTDDPTILGQVTTFTATAQGSNLVYTWNFGDGSPVISGSSSTMTHTYPAITTYTAVVTVTNASNSQQISFPVQIRPATIYLYLPLVQNAYNPAPDLVVERLTATANNVEVVIKNQGDARVEDSFWVDVYLNPATAPTRINQTWSLVGDQGLAWGVTDEALPIMPGESITLTVNDVTYAVDYSSVSWPLAVGTQLYAQVDSVGDSAYGAIRESDELADGVYNNIAGPVVSMTVAGQQPLSPPQLDPSLLPQERDLPERP